MTEPDCKPYEEEFAKRFVVDFHSLAFKLAAALNKDGEPIESIADKPENVSHHCDIPSSYGHLGLVTCTSI